MEAMEAIKPKRPDYINLPIKLSLTDIGYTFFVNNNKKVEKIRLADNELTYGISFKKISYDYLKKLISANFINKVEIYSSEFISYRSEIIDLNKLLFHEFLYQKFNSHLFNKILNTGFITNWNRKNPTKPIDELTKFNDSLLKENLIGKNDKIKNYINCILNEFVINLNKSALLTNEKNIKIQTAKKILVNIKNFIWYLLLQSEKFNEIDIMLNIITVSLIEFIEKIKISEYLSLIIMEIINHAENSKIKKYLKLKYRKDKIDELIVNKGIRASIYQNMKDKKDYIYISWKIRGNNVSLGTDKKFKVVIMNKEYDYRTLKNDIENKYRTNLKGKSLIDLYNESQDKIMNNELGLYYLSYLNETCKDLNIKFESYVSQSISNDFPIISLSFKIK